MADNQNRTTGWHLQREVPIALIVALLVQLAAGVTYINKLDTRQSMTEQHLTIMENQIKVQREEQALRDRRQDELAALADRTVIERLDKLDAKIDRLIERRAAR